MDDLETRGLNDSEALLRGAMARAEKAHALHVKRSVAVGLVAGAFVTSFVGSFVGQAPSRRASAELPPPRIAAAPAPEIRPIPGLSRAGAAVPSADAEVAREPDASKPAPPPKPPPPPEPPPGVDSKPSAPKTVERAIRAAAPERVSVRIAIGPQGFEPSVVRVRAGVPLTVTVAKGEGCSAGFLMPDLGVSKDNSGGPVSFGIGPLKAGVYRFTCGMQMVEGRMVVS